MISDYDLHCHSTASDGALSPAAVVETAHAAGVKTLALTDHDTTAGLAEAAGAAAQLGMALIPALELSLTWQEKCFHIVGLNVDAASAPLQHGLETMRNIRDRRAEEMAKRLEKKGIPGALEGARALAGEGMITRTHFARYVVDQGRCSTLQAVFDRYIGAGKSAFVRTQWVSLEEGVSWIVNAGGVAVLAHPMRYNLSTRWMRRFLSAFKEAGGRGIEVVSGRGGPDEVQVGANYARQFDLLGSVGSDFHSPEMPWVQLGRLAPLPAGIIPVWSAW